MKKSRLSYDEWKCMISKDLCGTFINTDFFIGYIGLLDIKAVSEVQIWNYNGQKITVCDKGIKWLSVLSRNDHYCITAMIDEKNELLLWYIDIIMGQGIDTDGVPYFEDLYLDLIVYPDGTVVTDDMDELEEALQKKDISPEQFNLAIDTCNKLKNGLLSDIVFFKEYTQKCLDLTAEAGNPAWRIRMEVWDGYFKDGIRANVDLIRGEIIPEGLYHLVCEVLVRHADGEFLLMQRDLSKLNYGGYFEATAGGSALKNEDKLSCIKRELLEETGISEDNFEEIGQFVSQEDSCIFHIFLCTTTCDKNNIILQVGETMSYKWVSEEEFIAFINSDNMIDKQRKRYLKYFIEKGYIHT